VLILRDILFLSLLLSVHQWSGGAGTRQLFPANIFEPERHSGKYCLSQPERWYCSVLANQLVLKKVTLQTKSCQLVLRKII